MVCAFDSLQVISTDSSCTLPSALVITSRPVVAEEDVPSTQVPEGKKEPKKRKKKGDDDEEGEGEADGDAEPSEKKAKAVSMPVGSSVHA